MRREGQEYQKEGKKGYRIYPPPDRSVADGGSNDVGTVRGDSGRRDESLPALDAPGG